MKDTEKQYWKALERIKNKKNTKPTRAKVAIEAGCDASSIKPERYPALCEAINNEEIKWNNRGKSRDTKTIEKLNKRIKELESQQERAYNRELMLIAKIRELELELSSKQQSSGAITDLSMNLPDWTKM